MTPGLLIFFGALGFVIIASIAVPAYLNRWARRG